MCLFLCEYIGYMFQMETQNNYKLNVLLYMLANASHVSNI